jgi:hypothetical protein
VRIYPAFFLGKRNRKVQLWKAVHACAKSRKSEMRKRETGQMPGAVVAECVAATAQKTRGLLAADKFAAASSKTAREARHTPAQVSS